MVGLLGESSIFSTPLGQLKFPEVSNFLCILMLSFWQTFQNNLGYASTSNIREFIKFYSLGDKTFETDFRNILGYLKNVKLMSHWTIFNDTICNDVALKIAPVWHAVAKTGGWQQFRQHRCKFLNSNQKHATCFLSSGYAENRSQWHVTLHFPLWQHRIVANRRRKSFSVTLALKLLT